MDHRSGCENTEGNCYFIARGDGGRCALIADSARQIGIKVAAPLVLTLLARNDDHTPVAEYKEVGRAPAPGRALARKDAFPWSELSASEN